MGVNLFYPAVSKHWRTALAGLLWSGVGYDSAEIVEDLAETWEQSDELTHIFYLRRGVRWHDISPVSGRELVADDVKLSFERLAAMRPTPPR